MNFCCKVCTLNCVDKIYLDTTSPIMFYKKTGCTEMPRSVKGVSEAINSLVENIFGEIMDGSLALNSAAGGGSQGLDSLTPLYT